MRKIKFRAWDGDEMYYDIGVADGHAVDHDAGSVWYWHQPAEAIMQFTGLHDKNGDTGCEIYEYDIIDDKGIVIGNKYESPHLLENKANLLIQGFGTKDWLTTYKRAVGRGCHDA